MGDERGTRLNSVLWSLTGASAVLLSLRIYSKLWSRRPPSTCTAMRVLRPFSSSVCWVSARPISQGEPACVSEVSGEAPVPLLTLNPDLPAAFVQVVEKMMAKVPDERYPSAAAVEAELRAWASDEAVLSLDRPEDAAFTAPAQVLQNFDTSADFSLPDLSAAEQEAGEHQSHRDIRVDSRSAVVSAVEIHDFCT